MHYSPSPMLPMCEQLVGNMISYDTCKNTTTLPCMIHRVLQEYVGGVFLCGVLLHMYVSYHMILIVFGYWEVSYDTMIHMI